MHILTTAPTSSQNSQNKSWLNFKEQEKKYYKFCKTSQNVEDEAFVKSVCETALTQIISRPDKDKTFFKDIDKIWAN